MSIYPERKLPGYTYFDEFQFNGKSYYLNTIVELRYKCYKKNNQLVQLVEHGKCESGIPFWKYAIWTENGDVTHLRTHRAPDQEVVRIIEPATRPPCLQKPEYYSDIEVPGMGTAWLIYIFVMIFSLIFVSFTTVWVFATWFFWNWRLEILRKPDRHDYGFNIQQKGRELNEWQT